MKAWTLAVLLIAAVLAEKALARPGSEAEDPDDDNFQDDDPADHDDAAPPSGPKPAPKLLSAPLVLTPKPGDTVWLPCNVENVDTIVWLNGSLSLAVNALRLTFKDDTRLTFHPNHTLEIRNVMPTDSGAYTCKINDALQIHHEIDLFGAGNGAPITRISFGLLLGATLMLLTRS